MSSDQPTPLSEDDLDQVNGGLGNSQFATNAAIFTASGDLQSLIQQVQIERQNMLEAQLSNQVAEVQARSDQLSNMNNALGVLNALRPVGEDQSVSMGHKIGDQTLGDYLKDKGVDLTLDTNGNGVAGQSEFDVAIATLKGQIDTVSNQNQMDMVRLQSLMDKRNQAYDLITTALAKIEDQNNSIIGNMR